MIVYGDKQQLEQTYEFTPHGVLVYKIFGMFHPAPRNWEIEPCSLLLDSNLDCNVRRVCGPGINCTRGEFFSSFDFTNEIVWAGIIPWTAHVVVPMRLYGYCSSKIRTDKLYLLDVVNRQGDFIPAFEMYQKYRTQLPLSSRPALQELI